MHFKICCVGADGSIMLLSKHHQTFSCSVPEPYLEVYTKMDVLKETQHCPTSIPTPDDPLSRRHISSKIHCRNPSRLHDFCSCFVASLLQDSPPLSACPQVRNSLGGLCATALHPRIDGILEQSVLLHGHHEDVQQQKQQQEQLHPSRSPIQRPMISLE